MFGQIIDELARLITEKIDKWLDNVTQQRIDNGINLAPPPNVIYLTDGFTENVNFNSNAPYIILYIQRIRTQPFTFCTNDVKVTLVIEFNDFIGQNFIDLIDNIYKFVGTSINSINEKYKGVAEVQPISDIVTYYDSKRSEVVFRYVTEIPLKVIIKNYTGEL